MNSLSKNETLLALKREFGRWEADRLRKRAAEDKARKAKLIKAVKTLFTPAPVLRFS